MNFFKHLGSAVDKLNSIGNMTHQKNFFSSKPDPLTELIRTCSYPEEVKFIIEKSVKQVCQVYPSFAVDKLEYAEGGFQKRFIEIKGEIAIQLRGKIKLNIMYPTTFPKSAPYLRIINPNPIQFAPTSLYLPLQSNNDSKSYVLNERLNSVNMWNSSTSVVTLIIEANNMIKGSFPFQPNNKQQPTSNNWGNAYKQGYATNMQYPQNQGNYNQGYNQGPKQPPIPFHTANYANCYPKAHQLVTQQRKKLQELSKKHQPLLANIQTLDCMNYAVDSASIQLNVQNKKMLDFFNQTSKTENVSLNNVVVPADHISSQILDLTASIKAREDAVHMLQAKFNEEEINLQSFLKNLRRMEEGKFEEKTLLIKCLQTVSRIVA